MKKLITNAKPYSERSLQAMPCWERCFFKREWISEALNLLGNADSSYFEFAS